MTKKKKSEVRYPGIEFGVEEFPGCCGIEVMFGFDGENQAETYEPTNWYSEEEWKEDRPYKTRQQQLNAMYKSFEERRSAPLLQVALVTRYANDKPRAKKKGQFPDLFDYLKNKKKWTMCSKHIGKHGHEITVLSKKFPKKTFASARNNFW